MSGTGDDRTIREVLGDLEDMGFTGQFMAREGAQVQCAACHGRSHADATMLMELRRLEGASDPDDMLAVIGLVCPHCRARGTAVLGYGPEADIADAEVLARIEDARRAGP